VPKTLYAADAGPDVHTGAGKLVALLLSTSAANALLTIYDNTAASGTVLLNVSINAYESPVYIRFPDDVPLTFTTGLYLSIPANTYAHVWAIGF